MARCRQEHNQYSQIKIFIFELGTSIRVYQHVLKVPTHPIMIISETSIHPPTPIITHNHNIKPYTNTPTYPMIIRRIIQTYTPTYPTINPQDNLERTQNSNWTLGHNRIIQKGLRIVDIRRFLGLNCIFGKCLAHKLLIACWLRNKTTNQPTNIQYPVPNTTNQP